MLDPSIPPGFEPVDVGAGFSITLGPLYINRAAPGLGIRVGPAQCNPVGTCHGGALSTFADAQIIAVRRGSELRTEHHPTISLTIDFLAPVRAGDWLESETVVDRTTNTLIFIRSLMHVGGNPVARSSAVYRNIQHKGV